MTLVPAVLAVVVLGISPIGVWMADWLGTRLGLPSTIVLGFLYVAFIAIGVAVMKASRRVASAESLPSEDSPSAMGDGRGQAIIKPLAIATVVAAIVVALTTSASLPHLLLMAGTMAVALVPVGFQPTKWPPRLPKYRTPNHVRLSTSSDDSGDPDRVALSYTWTFDSLMSTTQGSGRLAKHSASVPIRRSVYDDFRNRPHPHWREHPDQHGVLAHYIGEGSTNELQRCASELAEKASKFNLPYLDFVRFVLAFTADGIAEEGTDRNVKDDRFVRYPVETLFEKRGTTLDRTVLAATLLQQLGVQALLIVGEAPDGTIRAGLGVRTLDYINVQHVSCFDFEDAQYFYCYLAGAKGWSFSQANDVKSAKAISPLSAANSEQAGRQSGE